MAKKPNAFKSSAYRDDIVPEGDFTLIWEHLKQTGIHDDDCRYMVSLLSIADTYDCEEALGCFALASLEAGSRVSIKVCRDFFAPMSVDMPQYTSQQHDFSEITGVTALQIKQKTAQLDWLKQGHNVLLFGASGLGKTHLAAAIGYALIEQAVRVKFMSSTSLVQMLQKAKEELSLEFELKKLDKYELLILDDIGYVKKTNSESQVLFELIAHRYERNSLLITSNQAFSEWDSIFTDNMMTVAAIDRLIHHASIYQIEGESYRKKQAMKN